MREGFFLGEKFMTNPESNSGAVASPGKSGLTLAALLVALAALVGSLLLSVALGLKACPLCFYQRTFIMGVVGVLGVGLGVRGMRPGLLSFLALPAALGGLGVALWHNYLELVGRLECPLGVLELGTAPQQSLAAFALLVVLLMADVLRNIRGLGVAAIVAPILLGAVFTVAVSNPQVSPGCKPDYSQPLDGCRPPQAKAK
jgi:disulfide bond formation protein DsbB